MPLDQSHGPDVAPLSLICGNVGPAELRLFVGGAEAAGDRRLLARHGITTTLNCAVNVDVPPLAPYPDGGVVRQAKVGMIDGPGNPPALLHAALNTLHGLFAQASPGKPDYPPHRTGNVLVHCRAGKSRSVTVAALYLHAGRPDLWPDFEAALNYVIERRGLHPDMPGVPTQAMRDLAGALLSRGIENLLI